MKNPTEKQRETLRVILLGSVAVISIAQALRKERIKSQDTAVMYLDAAITELEYGLDADMQIVDAAVDRFMECIGRSPQKKEVKKFPPGGIISSTPPGEAEYIIPTKKPTR